MPTPPDILNIAFKRASQKGNKPIVKDSETIKRVELVCRNKANRAGVRFLMACLLAKIHKPEIDIRKPYTEIGDTDCYSGRTYDETYISPFINEHDLPCNQTTAFLTPALRNRNITLTPDLDLVGRPPKLYQAVLELLTCVHTNKVSAEDVLAEIVRCLLIYRNERKQRINILLEAVKSSEDTIPLSAEAIVTLIQQHLNCPRSSRLPVLVVAAAYKAAERHLGERVLPLQSHTAADKQTKALGDLEISLRDENDVITSYEMKTRKVTKVDIDNALQKIINREKKIDNYIFITTDVIEDEVSDYAASIYDRTGGIEVVVLDCIGFLRHFLHLFYRLRIQFLEVYQRILLQEPDSAVRQELKEAFIALRQAAESGEY